jgi:hypothetical protein
MQSEIIIKNSNDAIQHYDDVEAVKLLQEVEKLLSSNEVRNNPVLLKRLEKIRVYLKIVAVPQLSDEETANILKNYYLDSFDAEIDMENRLTAKLFFIPEIPRDSLREKLKRALAGNGQKLGGLTISQWIYEFEKSHNVKIRNLSAAVDFVNTNRNALILSPVEKERLKDLLHTYDYLLVSTLPATGPILNEILALVPSVEKSSKDYSAFPQYSNYQLPAEPSESPERERTKLETMNMPFVLDKIPEVGEQLITSNKISLKNFPEPVRPSIKNWLSDYTFNTGYENHNAMTRGAYLFQNVNARTLNHFDRQRLDYILKAYDENFPVSVNLNTKQIVFSEFSVSAKRPAARSNFSAPSTDVPRDIFQTKKEDFFSQKKPIVSETIAPRPVFPVRQSNFRPSGITNFGQNLNNAGGEKTDQRNISPMSSGLHGKTSEKSNFSFSSSQRMPFESQSKETGNKIISPSAPQPLKITPRNFQKNFDEKDLPKNVVNLKE